ncbi:GMC family oxidoreductase [Pseudonocardia broussonetiae]|uniref:GMC family oxidoreductase n=1 Tax=Pseudonocardia broussonetiae TaxID=2736640 RepID=A0A6M6JI38_9PSEU|nr:GMC family oxidoreductase [Pseudonocardia broussonetiae]QJY46079.1 GMC family oxidoreductase [Pseudonocardia broussonetiae]
MRPNVIVVGSGAAGAALAHRLTADPTMSVLVLEAGPRLRPDVVATPARWPETLGGPFDYGYRTTPQAALGGRVLDYPRGRLLGGTTMLNAMIHAVPPAADLDAWGPDWSADQLRGALAALDGGQRRGATGPALNRPVPEPNPLSVAFVEACTEAGHERVADLNDTDEDGVGWMDLALTDEGSRADAALTYLDPITARPNLEIRSDSTVERILFEDGRVHALQLRTGDRGHSELPVDGAEVILCAGAIDSPGLLLRSGIGPRAELAAAGVPLRHDLRGVGRNLHDHPLVPVVWRCEQPVEPPTAQFFESQLVLRHDPRSPGALAIAFGHIPFGAPDVEHGASALIGLYGPHSRGSLRLDPDDPDGALLIDPALLADDRDLAAARRGVEVVREVATRSALAPFGLTELAPLAEGADLDGAIAQLTGSFMHPVGTCALGDGPDAVVGRDLLVRGFANLRVADASVIPRIPSVATSVSAQLIGWRLAERMVG